MSGFATRSAYFIVVVCLISALVGVATPVRMPIDLFPAINIPAVVMATRAIVAVFFSIPLSAAAAFIAPALGGSSINSMVLLGLAPAAYVWVYGKS